jgi:hypothetical protein
VMNEPLCGRDQARKPRPSQAEVFLTETRCRSSYWALTMLLAVLITACSTTSAPPQESASTATPIPSLQAATPTATPIPSLPSGRLEPGTYVLSAIDPGFDASHRITISVPDGYEGYDGWAVLTLGTHEAGLNFAIVNNVFADPCRWHGTLPDPPVGPRVADLVAAMANQPGRHATTPTDVTLDGYSGKQMELTALDDFAGCDLGRFQSWTFSPGESDTRYHHPGQHDLLWILDVDGVRLVLDVSYDPGTSKQDRAELLEMVDSVHIQRL